MPIWLRRFTIQTMNEYFENQNKEVEKNKKPKSDSILKGPSIKSPTYALKARK